MTPEYLWLWVWGVIVGLDLVSGPQVMIARPLVAASVAGWVMGDPLAGVTVGVVLELCALEIMPFGGSRYPDYGVAGVVAAAVAAGAPQVVGVGLAVGVGFLVAHLGDVGVQLVRRGSTHDVASHADALARGDVATVHRLHYRGLARDAARGGVLMGVALPVVALLRSGATLPLRVAVGATAVVLGVAAGTAGASVVRYTGGTVRGPWYLGAGLVVGMVWVLLA